MTRQQETILRLMSKEHASPAFRQMRELASNSSVEATSNSPERQTAREALSIWSVRFRNAGIRGKRFVGLADLVRELRELPPEDLVEQISLSSDTKTGVAFFHVGSEQFLGAVLSSRTQTDKERSKQNWQTAIARPRRSHDNQGERKRPESLRKLASKTATVACSR